MNPRSPSGLKRSESSDLERKALLWFECTVRGKGPGPSLSSGLKDVYGRKIPRYRGGKRILPGGPVVGMRATADFRGIGKEGELFCGFTPVPASPFRRDGLPPAESLRAVTGLYGRTAISLLFAPQEDFPPGWIRSRSRIPQKSQRALGMRAPPPASPPQGILPRVAPRDLLGTRGLNASRHPTISARGALMCLTISGGH